MNGKKRKVAPQCASCDVEVSERICTSSKGSGSRGCPTIAQKAILKKAEKEYEALGVNEFARQASKQEGECYANRHEKPYVMQPTKTRIVEICEFARKMGYRRIGLAFCLGLRQEARIAEKIFRVHGLDVVSAVCKVGRVPKERIGIRDEEKIHRGEEEAMCNPVFQARLFNEAPTDFNVLLGLCVGHDSLFFKYSDAPTTVLAVKDRVTGHNPLVALYLHEGFYRKIMHPQAGEKQ